MVQTATRCPPPQLESVRGVNTGFTLTAEDVAKALRARKVGGGWIACCPAHHDREPSLSIREAKPEQPARIGLDVNPLWLVSS